MSLYTRQQLALILALVLAAGAGMFVGQWRRAHPELAMEVESLGRPVDSPGTARSQLDRRIRRADAHGTRANRAGEHALPIATEGAVPVTADTREALTARRVDLNRASAAELARLPGVGPVLAERIVEVRASAGPFASVDELQRVAGFGRWKLERMRTLVVVEH
jgi:competence ComEA-like helix-hairpin-helix protein